LFNLGRSAVVNLRCIPTWLVARHDHQHGRTRDARGNRRRPGPDTGPSEGGRLDSMPGWQLARASGATWREAIDVVFGTIRTLHSEGDLPLH